MDYLKVSSFIWCSIALICIVLLGGCGGITGGEPLVTEEEPNVEATATSDNSDADVAIATEIDNECNSLSGIASSFCLSVVDKRISYLEKYSEDVELRGRVADELATLHELVSDHESKVAFLCKIRPNRTVQCLRYSSMVALLSNDKAMLAIADLKAIVDAYDILGNVAIKCEDGNWGDIIADESELEGDISIELALAMLEQCAKQAETTDDTGEQDLSSGAISGVTGIDPFGSYCGLELESGIEQEQIEQTIAQAEEMAAQCENTLSETMTEGTSTSTVTVTTEEDGTITTEITNEDGTKTTIKTSTTTDSEGNTTHTAQITSSDTDGNVVGITMQETSDASGNVIDSSMSVDVNGTTVDVNPSDVSVSGTLDTDPQVSINVWNIGDDAGFGTRAKIEWGPGKWMDVNWYGPNTSRIETASGKAWWLFNDSTLQECLDEMCSTCKNFMEYYPELLHDCNGNNLGACQRFSEAAECCSNPDALPADPTIIIPNPDGNMACYNVEPDIQQDKCNLQCSIAYHEDCLSNCMSSVLYATSEFDLMDQICTYAYSEECILSQGGLDVSETESPPGSLPPLPDNEGYFLFPQQDR